jgi:hypothetical protein
MHSKDNVRAYRYAPIERNDAESLCGAYNAHISTTIQPTPVAPPTRFAIKIQPECSALRRRAINEGEKNTRRKIGRKIMARQIEMNSPIMLTIIHA